MPLALVTAIPLRGTSGNCLPGKALTERGLLMLSCGQSVIRIAPPLSINKTEVDEGMRMFEEALTQAEKELM